MVEDAKEEEETVPSKEEEEEAAQPVAVDEKADDEESETDGNAQPVTADEKADDEENGNDENAELEEEANKEEDFEEETEDGTGQRKRRLSTEEPEAKKQKVESNTVVVKNLPLDVSDAMVLNFFVGKGLDIVEIKRRPKAPEWLLMDLSGPEALPTAYSFNGKMYKGSKLEVTNLSDENLEANISLGQIKNELKVYIGNLPSDATKESLEETFPGIECVWLPRWPDKSLKGYCFLVYKTDEEAEEAIQKYQDIKIGDHKLTVSKWKERDTESKSLFAKNLSADTTEESLKEAFEGCEKTQLLKDKDGKSKRVGFIIYSTAEAAKQALKTKADTTVDGQKIDLSLSSLKESESKSVFVKNLSLDTTEDTLKEAFKGCERVKILLEKDGKSKGIGFVAFNTPEEAKEALGAMDGSTVDGQKIELALAFPKGSRQGGRPIMRGRGGRGGPRGGGPRGGGFHDRNGQWGNFQDRGGRWAAPPSGQGQWGDFRGGYRPQGGYRPRGAQSGGYGGQWSGGRGSYGGGQSFRGRSSHPYW